MVIAIIVIICGYWTWNAGIRHLNFGLVHGLAKKNQL
jgi:hypothetical protein